MNKKTKSFGVVSLLISAGLFLVGYACWFILESIEEKRDAIDRIAAQGEIYTEKLQEKDALVKQYEIVQKQRFEISNIFIYREELVSVIEQLEMLARVSGLEIQLDAQEGVEKKIVLKSGEKDTRTDEEKAAQAADEKSKIIFTVEAMGPYAAILEFIGRVELMHPVASFESVFLEKEPVDKNKSFLGEVVGEESSSIPEVPKNISASMTLIFRQNISK